MKYYRWTEKHIMNMSWANYHMYLHAIPKPEDNKTEEDNLETMDANELG